MKLRSGTIFLAVPISLFLGFVLLHGGQKAAMSEIRIGDKILSLDLVLGTGPRPENRFRFPYSLAVDGKGRILVADRGNRRVQIFDAEGRFVQTIGGRKRIGINLAFPKALALDDAGNIYVGDYSAERARLLTLDRSGRFIKGIRLPYEASQIGFLNGQLFIGTKDMLSSANVYLIGPDGQVTGKIDECPAAAALWETRVNVTRAPDGRIFLANEFLPAVRAYSPAGKLDMEFRYKPLTKNYKNPDPWMAGGIVDEGVHQLLCYDIAVDPDGSIYLLVATDWKANEVCSLYMFDPLGRFREAVDLSFPCSSMRIDGSGRFYFLSQMVTGCLYRFRQLSEE
jgi:sugar lactone lactonase YvrE